MSRKNKKIQSTYIRMAKALCVGEFCCCCVGDSTRLPIRFNRPEKVVSNGSMVHTDGRTNSRMDLEKKKNSELY